MNVRLPKKDVNEVCVQKLSSGLVRIYEPDLKQIKFQLNELSDGSSTLLQQLHEENMSIAEVQHSDELHGLFNKIEMYHNKLVNIKKDMRLLHEKGIRLKKRSLKLQEYSEKQLQMKEQKKTALRMEESLICTKKE